MLPVYHLSPPVQTHGPDLSVKKFFSTFSWPIFWYNRATGESSFYGFLLLAVAEDTRGSFDERLLLSLNLD